MTKRALKRTVREGAFDQTQFHNDDGGKVRRLPVGNGWSPLGRDEDREQGYLKTIKAKSPGQTELMAAIDAKNLVMALGPAGTGKTYLAMAKAVAALAKAIGAAGATVKLATNSTATSVPSGTCSPSQSA